MPDRQTCIDCGALSPETETNYTLISSQFGWRLTRVRKPDGSFAVEWRCPTCWKEYKQRKAATEEVRRGGEPGPAAHTAPSTRPLPSFPSRHPPPPAPARRPEPLPPPGSGPHRPPRTRG